MGQQGDLYRYFTLYCFQPDSRYHIELFNTSLLIQYVNMFGMNQIKFAVRIFWRAQVRYRLFWAAACEKLAPRPVDLPEVTVFKAEETERSKLEAANTAASSTTP